jgi:D-sedoheptulose 7-phosphate isomerase
VTETAAADLAEHITGAQRLHDLLPLVEKTGDLLIDAFGAGHRLYTFGNGGSAADAQHLAAEFVGRYRRERRPLPAVSLTTDASVSTCISNDYDAAEVFARQLTALAEPGDVVIGFTTSGRSPNVVRGLAAARLRGATTVLFGGKGGGPAAEHADLALVVDSDTTARIQEMHLLMLHLVSEQVDRWAAPEAAPAVLTTAQGE